MEATSVYSAPEPFTNNFNTVSSLFPLPSSLSSIISNPRPKSSSALPPRLSNGVYRAPEPFVNNDTVSLSFHFVPCFLLSQLHDFILCFHLAVFLLFRHSWNVFSLFSNSVYFLIA